MAWWCFDTGHITKRQLRIWFAAQEMLEKRRYTAKPEHARQKTAHTAHTPQTHHTPRKPSYGLNEIKALIGGRGSKTADTAIKADLKKLGALGLVSITQRSITFATSIDQLTLNGSTDDLSSFWTMFHQLPHPRRRVPVPRRVLRALAGGFTSGMTAVVLATLIRSLFWHKSPMGGNTGSGKRRSEEGVRESGVVCEASGGAYRIDGRTKREWIAEVFGITTRTVTDARARLIELGWLIPLETHQHLLNRYGTHDQINTDWKPISKATTSIESGGGGGGVDIAEIAEDRAAKSSTPSTDFSAKSSSLINRYSPSSLRKKNLNTRKPAQTRAGNTGASLRVALKTKNQSKSKDKIKAGSRKKKSHGNGVPNIRDIRANDLADTGRLLELHAQAIKIGLAHPSEAGRLDFVALAQRARMSGKRAGGGALFFWLLREKKTLFITHAAEEEATRMIKEHLYGKQVRERQSQSENQQWGSGERERSNTPVQPTEFTKDEQFVIACIRVSKKHRIADPFRMAHSEGWTRDQWDTALASLENKQWEQMKQSRGEENIEE